MRALVKNAADEGQVKNADEKEKRGRERDLDDLFTVLSTIQGRRFVWRYLSLCGVFRTSFAGEIGQTAFNEGSRIVGLTMLNDINEADDTAYMKMLKESKERE